MYKPTQTHYIEWRGVRIEVRYCPSYSKVYEDMYGQPQAHLEIKALDPPDAALPMTSTGYRSHFTSPQAIEAEGGAVSFVLAWLNEAVQSSAWKAQAVASEQLSLL